MESLKKGQGISVEIPRPDGSTSLHVGEYVSHDPIHVCLKKHSWIVETGRRYLFLHGSPDSSFEWESSHPDLLTRLPLWGAVVQDYPWILPEAPDDEDDEDEENERRDPRLA